MRRLLVGLIIVAAPMAGGLPSAGAGGGTDSNAEREIVAAFEMVGDLDASIDARSRALEDGDELRKVLRETTELSIQIDGVKLSGKVFRDIEVQRIHDRSAEVSFGIYIGPNLVSGWNGVAIRQGDRWVMARGTLCSMLVDWTAARCPSPNLDVPEIAFVAKELSATEQDGASVALGVRFADGSTAEVLVPRELRDGWQGRPLAAVTLGSGEKVDLWLHAWELEPRQPVRTYRGVDGARVVYDAEHGLVMPAGEWTITAYAQELSERARKEVARHVTGRTAKDGFVVLDTTGSVRLGNRSPIKSTKSSLNVDAGDLPIELSRSTNDSYALLVVTLGECPAVLQPAQSSPSYVAEERCLPGVDARIAVEGAPEIAWPLLDGVRVTNIQRPESAKHEAVAFV